MNVGDFKKYRDRVVFITNEMEVGGVKKIGCMGAFSGGYNSGTEDEYSVLPENVLKFCTLIGHAPNMTCDELDHQIGKMFGGK